MQFSGTILVCGIAFMALVTTRRMINERNEFRLKEEKYREEALGLIAPCAYEVARGIMTPAEVQSELNEHQGNVGEVAAHIWRKMSALERDEFCQRAKEYFEQPNGVHAKLRAEAMALLDKQRQDRAVNEISA